MPDDHADLLQRRWRAICGYLREHRVPLEEAAPLIRALLRTGAPGPADRSATVLACRRSFLQRLQRGTRRARLLRVNG
jgi:hypothetical protein